MIYESHQIYSLNLLKAYVCIKNRLKLNIHFNQKHLNVFFLINHEPIRSTKRKDLIPQTTTGLLHVS
ncbi:unnamed protein product [Arabidopsis halleri]